MRRFSPLVIFVLTLSLFSFPTFLNGIIPPANAASTSFSFAASGDIGSLTASTSVNILNSLASASSNFFLGLGDFSYDPSVTGNTWCGQFKSSFNGIQILSGDHDTGGHALGFPETHDYAKYLNGCPLTLSVGLTCGPVSGNCYGKEYFFDYPALNPIARIVLASPKIYNITGVCNNATAPNGCSSQTGQPCIDQYGCWPYASGDLHFNWVSNAIDSARATGIKWVIVATHKLCISASDGTCSMGLGFFNMLVQKKVDLIIQAHDNAYERSKQIALNGASGCSSVTEDANGYALYNSRCVVDAGTQGNYTSGAGSVVMVQGAWINDLYSVNDTSLNGGANAAEAPYFVKLMGSNTLGNGLGFTKYTISASRIDVKTNFSGNLQDSFSIIAPTAPLPGLSGPAVVPGSIPSGETKLYKLSTERASFYANGLYWVFWENTGTCEGQSGCFYYATSPDGQTWNTPVNLGVHVNREDFSVITNSTHVFYARYNETSFFSASCNRALLFRVGVLSNTIAWQPERIVKLANKTASWLNPVLRLDSNNQAWIGYLDFSNSGCGGNGTELPAVVHSAGTNYGSWRGYTYLSTSLSRNWVVDLASLPGGAMYATYSVYDSPTDLRGRLFNSTWRPEERISPASDLLDTDAFVFSSGNTVYAVWLDTNTRTLSYSGRVFSGPSSGTWNATVRIATAECCASRTSYPVPWTAAYDTGTSKIYIFWYNYTLNRIDVYSGLSATWTGPTPGWSTVNADGLASLTTFQYSANTGTNNTVGIAFIDNSSTSTPVLKYEVDRFAPSLRSDFTYNPSTPSPGAPVSFTASASEGLSPYAFSWRFGDGGTAAGSPVTHVYSTSGSYTVTLTTGDSANHTAVVSKNVAVVQTPDFKLAAKPSLLTVLLGQNTQSAIAVTSLGGFKGTVALAASASPPGLTVSMDHSSVTLSVGQTVNDNLKVVASKTAPTGVYIATVTGTSGSLTRTLNVTIRVPDFNMTANPVTMTVSPGSTGSAQILFQSLNGFQGGISTTVSVSPAGPKPTLNPNNPSLTANGTKSSVLSVQVPANQAAGVYNVTIKATSGSLIHLLVVQVHIGQHTSSTSVICTPSSVTVNQASTCTATVTDTSPSSPTSPTGSVTFAETGPTGSFSSTTCTLTSGNCSITFTPAANGTALITGTYGGDATHNTSTSAAANVTVSLRTTTTTLSCSPSSVATGQDTTCTATVADSSPGTASTPAGSTTFSESGVTGSFIGSPCTLVSGSCTVTFSASTIGTASITGAYTSSDTTHSASTSAAFPVTVAASILHNTTTAVSCTSPVIVNQASTCTTTVTDTNVGPTTPTGTLSLTETGPAGSFAGSPCTLVAGGTGVASCSVTFTATAAGTALINGTYSGDSTHSGSITTTAASVTVNSRTTSTTIVCQSPVVANQASSCAATVSDTSPGATITPSGNVNFTETGASGSFSSATCSLVSDSCSVIFTAIATGTATITGAYNGDTAHTTSTSTGASVTVNPRTTSTTITCTSPVVVNQASNCTVTVTDSSGGSVVTPTGNVSFTSDSPGTFSTTSCNIAAVSTGVAQCNVSYTPGTSGNHLITASYTGDAVHFGGNNSSTITVGQRSTGTTVSCAPNGVGVNQACTATVADNSPGTTVTPAGLVSFTTNSTGSFSSNSCTLSGTGTAGVARCQVIYTPAAVATHAITGTYSGDTIHLASQGSASIGFGKDSTSTTIACSPSSVAMNQATTCSVTLTDTASIGPMAPTGTVSFTSNSAGSFTGSPCTLVSQTATSSGCQVTYKPTSGAGSHSIAATYNGDANHNGSNQTFSLTVTLRTTSTSVSCSPSSVVVNQATSCTAIVTDTSGPGAMTPTGNVVFTPGGTCVLVSGSCSVSITPSASGSLSVSASYGGDPSHSLSSGSTTVAVASRSTATGVSCSPSPVTNGTATSCVATVNDTDVGGRITPAGSVSFASSSTGVFAQPSCTLSTTGTVGLASCSVNYTPGVTGTHGITASFGGDSSHLGSSGSVTVSVVASSSPPAYALVVSSDGKVSRLYQNGTLTLVGQPVTTALRSVSWKPDGSYALISGDSAVLLKYDGTTLTSVQTGISTGFNFWTVSWKPDGSYALIGGTSGILFKYDGVKVTTILNTSTTILAINWQPSGSYALLVGKVGLALTYDGITVRSFATGTSFDLDAAAWNPNGLYALVGGLNRTLLQFNGTGIAAMNTSIIPPNNAIRAISFNPTGSLALLAGDSGMVLTWNGSTLTMLPTLTSSWLYSISWSPSGTAYIVGGSGTVLTYANGTLAKLTTSPITTTQYRGIGWKPQ